MGKKQDNENKEVKILTDILGMGETVSSLTTSFDNFVKEANIKKLPDGVRSFALFMFLYFVIIISISLLKIKAFDDVRLDIWLQIGLGAILFYGSVFLISSIIKKNSKK